MTPSEGSIISANGQILSLKKISVLELHAARSSDGPQFNIVIQIISRCYRERRQSTIHGCRS